MKSSRTRSVKPLIERGTADIEWVTLPGGSFMMGSADGRENERPVRRVTVKAFSLAKNLVTNRQFRAAVEAGVCEPPHYSDGTCLHWHVDKFIKIEKLPASFQGDEQPVLGVTWKQAKAFCEWVGGRLPTEAEWEYAARSAGKEHKYPWGNKEPTPREAVLSPWAAGTMPVGSSPAGATEQGLLDMAGNAFEWTQGWCFAPPDAGQRRRRWRARRGGAWNLVSSYARTTYRCGDDPAHGYSDGGFRPAR